MTENISDIDPQELNAEILIAHGQSNSYRLAELYALGAELKLAESDSNGWGFLLTHAYVFALESGHPDAKTLHAKLVADGRELSE